jgi:hypothetical protein
MNNFHRVLGLLGAGAVVTATLAQPLHLKDQDQRFPDVMAVKVRSSGLDRFDFDVTISSPYDTLQRYANAFRAMGKEGGVFGERMLLHDHADEQPFTRDLYGVAIPVGVQIVIVQARDLKYGYGGEAVEVALPGR